MTDIQVNYTNIFHRNDEVMKISLTALTDIIDSNFVGQRDPNDNPLPFKPGQTPKSLLIRSFENSQQAIRLEGEYGTSEDEWMFRTNLQGGFLIAKGCQSSAILAKQSKDIQKSCFELANLWYLIWQVFVETEALNQKIFGMI